MPQCPDAINYILTGTLNSFPFQLAVNSKGLLLMGAPFVFDWDRERIPGEVMVEHLREMEYVHQLQQSTIFCPACKKRRLIDRRIDAIVYCDCASRSKCDKWDNWEPYLERQNIIIWRKHQGSGQFAYKVYGSYADVSAEDFFYVQTSVDYRREWDKTAINLDIVDTDTAKASNCHVLYWEMLWPVNMREYI